MMQWSKQFCADAKPFAIRCGSRLPSAIVPSLEFVTWLTLIIVFIKAARKFGTADTSQLTDLLKAVTWPLVVVIVLLAMRRPLGAFLTGLSQRITKLSAFNVELELATIKTSVVKARR